jgi:predicted dehydrogenase
MRPLSAILPHPSDNIFGGVHSVSCLGASHIPERWNARGEKYRATADDAAYATLELAGGVIAQINSSWTTRVRRDDLVTFHVDGTHGSAVAGLTDVFTQAPALPRLCKPSGLPPARRKRLQWGQTRRV